MPRSRSIQTKSLGKIPSKHTSNIKLEPIEKVERFVYNEIADGPQVVSLPTPPYRHAFLVNITPSKIKISDWGGENNRERGKITPDSPTEGNLRNYTQFMDLLEEKYSPRKIEYYPVDQEQYDISSTYHDKCDGGGCSNYIYAWIDKHNSQIWEDAAAPAVTKRSRSRSSSRSGSTKKRRSRSNVRKSRRTLVGN